MIMQFGNGGGPPETGRVVTQDELADLFAGYFDGAFELERRPWLAVLDTSCVRTGLHFQLKNGTPPASLTTAADGSVHLFMEYETLVETQRKLPKFAKNLGVTVAELTRILNEDWLPHITVVRLPPELRQVDPRATAVRELDEDDYPAAALAAALSPCILLTHNYTDFGPLGMRSPSQGVDAVLAGIDLRVGEVHLNAVVMVPAMPLAAASETVKWAFEKVGPWAWALLGLLALGGVLVYQAQPQERKESIKRAAGKVGGFLVDEAVKATAEVNLARTQLRMSAVPAPSARTLESALMRELALSDESLSAQQLAELLNESLRPPVTALRAYLRANDGGLVSEVRSVHSRGLRTEIVRPRAGWRAAWPVAG